nr:hypothetical protein [Gammaproteobacteria bacterium]
MATTRFSASTLTDGGAFPVSLRALLRASIQGKRAHRRSPGHVVGGVVFDGGSFPQRLSRSLNPRRRRYRAAPLVASPEPGAPQQTRRWKRRDCVPTEALRNDRLHELSIIEAEVIHISQAPVADDSPSHTLGSLPLTR